MSGVPFLPPLHPFPCYFPARPIPPLVDCELTPLGRKLGEAFCGVWRWAEKNHSKVEAARKAFSKKRQG